MNRRMIIAPASALAILAAGPAIAGESWDELRPAVYGEREIEAAPEGTLSLTAPYRASDDREVPIGADVRLGDGAEIAAVTLIIDENPMPVSAVFELGEGRDRFSVLVNMRLNGPSPVRAVVETDDGRLLMAEAMVKTSGLGACAAPPVTDPDKALATLGEMTFRAAAGPLGTGAVAGQLAALSAGEDGAERARLEISHPSHSGMQKDQVSLLYIPAHFVQTVEVWEGEAKSFEMTGSISLSEDPEIEFTQAEDGPVRIRVTDTDGEIFERTFGGPAS